MTNALQIKQRLSAQEYLALYAENPQQRTELINGEVIILGMTKAIHQHIVIRLLWALMQAVIPQNLGKISTAPDDLYLDEENVFQPDIFFVSKDNPRCRVNDDGWWQGAPDFVVKVLSRSTAKYDRAERSAVYSRNGVREYWIIDPELRFVEVYVLDGDTYRKRGAYDDKQQVTPSVIPTLTINLADIFPPQEE